MHRCLFITFLTCYSFYLPTNAQDSAVADSLHAVDSGVGEDEIALADSSVVDTPIAISGADSLQVQDTVLPNQIPDTLPAAGVDVKKEKGVNGSLSRRTIEMTRNSLRKVLRTTFGYFKYFIVLFISCGIVLYTVFFYRRRKDNERFLTSTRLSVMDREVQLACKYMEENYRDSDLTIESMCEELVTGPAFLEALFEKELGMSVSEFIAQVRINRAKSILNKRPGIEADETALDIGFTDKKLFQQKFREITGLTFEEYRNANQNKEQGL